MPTYNQLQAEPWWGREIVTPELDWLGDEICRRTGQPREAFGTKGNNVHLRGAHRSQEWILHSRYCTNRSYTVQSGLTAEQLRHIAGADYVPGSWGTSTNRQLMVTQTRRLVDAMKSGRLTGVREVIGTLDGRTVVGTRRDGSTFSSDSSHLEHWHLTLDRRYCRDRSLMERVLVVALGEDDDMPTTAEVWCHKVPLQKDADGTVTQAWTAGAAVGYAARKAYEIQQEQIAARLRDEALLAAITSDDDRAAILAVVDARAAEIGAQLAESAAAETQRDAELRVLVEQGMSGQMDAAEVVRRMGALLSAAPAGQG